MEEKNMWRRPQVTWNKGRKMKNLGNDYFGVSFQPFQN